MVGKSVAGTLRFYVLNTNEGGMDYVSKCNETTN